MPLRRPFGNRFDVFLSSGTQYFPRKAGVPGKGIFMDYKKSHRMKKNGTILGLILAFAALLLGQSSYHAGLAVVLLGIFMILGSLLQGELYCRCPHCGSRLSALPFDRLPDYCPECGEQLD